MPKVPLRTPAIGSHVPPGAAQAPAPGRRAAGGCERVGVSRRARCRCGPPAPGGSVVLTAPGSRRGTGRPTAGPRTSGRPTPRWTASGRPTRRWMPRPVRRLPLPRPREVSHGGPRVPGRSWSPPGPSAPRPPPPGRGFRRAPGKCRRYSTRTRRPELPPSATAFPVPDGTRTPRPGARVGKRRNRLIRRPIRVGTVPTASRLWHSGGDRPTGLPRTGGAVLCAPGRASALLGARARLPAHALRVMVFQGRTPPVFGPLKPCDLINFLPHA